jgi:hypothetical protein
MTVSLAHRQVDAAHSPIEEVQGAVSLRVSTQRTIFWLLEGIPDLSFGHYVGRDSLVQKPGW